MKFMAESPKIIVITGPTATGKTALAVRLARQFDGEIVSADSRQVYRHMDIGTGKDLAEYTAGGTPVPFHLIDCVPPDATYNLHAFCRDARQCIAAIAGRGRLPIICGGTALYIDALLRGYALPGSAPDPAERAALDAMELDALNAELAGLAPEFYRTFLDRTNKTRLRRAIEIARHRQTPAAEAPAADFQALLLGVYYPRDIVHRRIAERLDARLAAGMIEEVRELNEHYGVSFEKLDFFGLEYRYVGRYLQNRLDFQTMRDELLSKIRQFAKRQDIFFRKMEREGAVIHWLRGGSEPDPAALVRRFLAGEPLPAPVLQLKEIHYGKKSS